jgi:hypothetical protein
MAEEWTKLPKWQECVEEGRVLPPSQKIYRGRIDLTQPFGIFSTLERPPECHERISEI